MISLDSSRWAELGHAYGNAADIPALLKQLEGMPASANNSEPWFTLWSALAHQGDVYDASFAAVPHVVRALASAPERADHSYFQFPAWVEICRARNMIQVPADLEPAYLLSLAQLPSLVATVSERACDAGLLVCMLAAVAVAKGQPKIAEAVLELTPEVAGEFMEWLFTR
ncbi:hypothetical protein [Burkholderia stabilis]|uniref:hypothetical protein n=1 Tax=Burkholderia stabilis TaxID=95485 RepID=UPI0009F51EF8|nr:hypothetical protein [Burkholderia stabilis]HDR9492197.1 hypothetical protein [Burkholderia stabilis]HDR9522441.1 hypothetical protein [Burkholderia stabilis]HDR9530295.1 hypothetical protein [Burkholderia stabilis]HDR9539819.1 hypothetical protein [Burkholderia stabilis]HDR9546266.1 hypothetical protein [Burkholderia stabilis]